MLELFTSALLAGATAGISSAAADAIKAAYAGVKNLIVTKFGKTRGPIESFEDDPADEDAQKLLAKRLADANVEADAEVQAAADKLRAALKAANINPGGVTQMASGTGNLQAAGNSNTLTSYNNTGSGTQHIGDSVNTGGGDYVKGNKSIDTGGGAYIGGGLQVGGDFAGRDLNVTHNYNTAPELSAILTAEARALVPMLNQYFGLSDIDSLCFDMGIDDEQLRGQTKDEKARSLVKYVEQNNRLDELKAHMRQVRPNLRARLS